MADMWLPKAKFPDFKYIGNGKRTDSRALAMNALIEREAVKDIVMPDTFWTYEDESIKRCVEHNGFAWIKVANPTVDHFPIHKTFKLAHLESGYSIRHNPFPAWRIIIASIPPFPPLKLFYFLWKTKSFAVSMNTVLYSFYMLKGLIDEVLGVSSDKKHWTWFESGIPKVGTQIARRYDSRTH